jgi:hypothetical protein
VGSARGRGRAKRRGARSRGAEDSGGFSREGVGTTRVLKKEDARLGTPQVGVFRRESATRILKTACVQHQAHHVVFSVSPFGSSIVIRRAAHACFSECKCPRFALKPQPKAYEEADSELSSEVSS